MNGETALGANSGFNTYVNTVTVPPIKRPNGKILYMENRPPIARSSNQKELIKFVLKV